MSTDIHHPSLSAYNYGKGIQISVLLVGVLQPPNVSEKKRHINAKPPVTTQVVYVYWNTKLIDGLIQIIG